MTGPAGTREATDSRKAYTIRLLVMAVVLAVAWALWSGLFKPLILALGALSVLLVLWAAHRMHLFDTDTFAPRFLVRLLRFWGWLGKEIVRSSLEVTRCVLNPRLKISPSVAEFESRCADPMDRTVLGNSITLTPGTLTLSIDGRRFVVHALSEEGAKDILGGEMDRRVSELRAG